MSYERRTDRILPRILYIDIRDLLHRAMRRFGLGGLL